MIRARAYRLAELRPWCTPDQNWTDAQQELKSPLLLRWRPRLLRWLGASDKSGWDWMEFSLKLSVPLTILILGSLLGRWNDDRQNQIAENDQKDEVLREYIKEMKEILLEEKVAEKVKQIHSRERSLARALAVTALAQLKGVRQERRDLLFQFLRETDLPILEGHNMNQGTNLSFADLRKTNLNSARLRGTDIRKADLSRAYLRSADLRGADLRGAALSGADLAAIKWDTGTRWPDKSAFKNAKNIPPELKEKLALD